MSAQLHLVSDAPATYADLEAAPAGYTVELIGGRLHAQPRPRLRHARAAIGLGALLAPPFDWGEGGPGGWVILEEPELHFIRDREVLVPDLGGWRAERLAGMDPDAHRFEVIPDWICEILSPSTARYDRADKLPIYQQRGVPWIWLIDPILRRVEVIGETTVVYEDPLEPVHMPPFDTLALPLQRLWL